MLKKTAYKFKQIFQKIGKTKIKIVKSGGLIPLYRFIMQTDLKDLFSKSLKETRIKSRILYPISELLIGMIVHILDGENRIYNYRGAMNDFYYEHLYSAGTIPHRNTFKNLLAKNKTLHKVLEKILLRFALNDVILQIKYLNLKSITIDVDQMPREVFGKQEGVAKGYSPRGKGHDLYQVQVWTIRELKTLLKLELRSGNTYSGAGFLSDLKSLTPFLKKLNVEILFVGDSGYVRIPVKPATYSG